MSQKTAIKISLFAAEEREQKLDRKGDLLSTLEKHVNFAALAAEIDRVAPRPTGKQGGRPPYPTELMVRALVLQHLYKLSDEALEYQLLDRLSFQRFCGLRHSSSIPDANILWVFRERVRAAGGADALFDAVQRQLQQHGFIAHGGQIIDATLVEAPRQHFRKAEEATLDQGETPVEWTDAQRRQKDTEASWTKKHGKSHHGYKLSISADRNANATSAPPGSTTPSTLRRCLTPPTPAVRYGRTRVMRTRHVNNASSKTVGGHLTGDGG